MGNTSPLISVIMPCYNQDRYLPDALQSILNQSCPSWECIIVNDGSTDHTAEICREWVSRDKRFRYLEKVNGGQSTARNLGLRFAAGDFIQFLDSDDVINPRKFELQLEALKGTPDYSLSISDYYYAESDDLTVPNTKWYVPPVFQSNSHLFELIKNWQVKLSIPIHCFLFKSSLFSDNQIRFDESLPNHVDWYCWMSLFRQKPVVKYVDQKLATYRIQPNAITRDKKQMKEGFLLAITRQKINFDKHSEEFKLLTRKYRQIRLDITTDSFVLGNVQIIVKKILDLKNRLFHSTTEE
jgi:glycosyltransferase involved in cell wall biosynthesis